MCSPIVDPAAPVKEQVQTANDQAKPKKQTIRGSSFTPVEDLAIAKAWIAASEDPIVGTEQKGNVFFSKIHLLFNQTFKPANRENRSMESIKTRCKAIHKECMAFTGCYSRVVRSHPTGVSANDLLSMATALYNGVEIQNVEDDCGRPFKFMLSWKLLKQHRKFTVAIEGSSPVMDKTTSSSTPSSKSGELEDKEVKDGMNLNEVTEGKNEVETKSRPVGRKRAKEMEEKRMQNAKKIRVAQEAVKVQQERNQALKRHYEIMLFTNAPDGCDQQESIDYFKIMRARALAELRREENENKDQEGK